ncbi:MAG: potassium channel family protein, partial [Paludibacter sp.]
MKFRTRLRTLIFRELLVPVMAIFSILLIGFLGLIMIEGFSPLQSLYMLVITFATIGYGDVVPVTDVGKIFTICIILAGFTVGLYAIGKISAFFVEGELSKLLKQRKMDKVLNAMNNHYIVCGYGKTGKHVLEELLKKGLEVVIIESDTERNEKLKELYSNKYI